MWCCFIWGEPTQRARGAGAGAHAADVADVTEPDLSAPAQHEGGATPDVGDVGAVGERRQRGQPSSCQLTAH